MLAGVYAIVVAGGEGRRFGRPKQFERLGDRLVVEWSVLAARSVSEDVVLVLPASALDDPALRAGCTRVAQGGATRAASVRSGLALVPPDAEIVLVHDAARPLASPALFASVVQAVRAGADGAVPGLPLADTVKRVRNDEIVETLDRSELFAVQTPQAFRAAVLRRAHRAEPEATDDAGLLESIGAHVVVVPGEARNLKITQLDDLVHVEHWVREGGVGTRPGAGPDAVTPAVGAPR